MLAAGAAQVSHSSYLAPTLLAHQELGSGAFRISFVRFEARAPAPRL